MYARVSLAHTHSRARVIDGQIKLRDGSIRDEAIDFEMLDFVSISSTDRTRKERATTPHRARYMLELWGKLNDRSLCRPANFLTREFRVNGRSGR